MQFAAQVFCHQGTLKSENMNVILLLFCPFFINYPFVGFMSGYAQSSSLYTFYYPDAHNSGIWILKTIVNPSWGNFLYGQDLL